VERVEDQPDNEREQRQEQQQGDAGVARQAAPARGGGGPRGDRPRAGFDPRRHPRSVAEISLILLSSQSMAWSTDHLSTMTFAGVSVSTFDAWTSAAAGVTGPGQPVAVNHSAARPKFR